MEDIPMPFLDLFANSSSWSTERRLLIWKVTCISACIIGSAVYLRPVEPYFGAEYFGILVPAFATGYIVINVADVFAMCMNYEHVFLEICFCVIGALGCSICGIYQLYRWIEWIIDTYDDPDADYGIQELVLALACIVHSVSLSAIVIHHEIGRRSSLRETEE